MYADSTARLVRENAVTAGSASSVTTASTNAMSRPPSVTSNDGFHTVRGDTVTGPADPLCTAPDQVRAVQARRTCRAVVSEFTTWACTVFAPPVGHTWNGWSAHSSTPSGVTTSRAMTPAACGRMRPGTSTASVT